MVAALKIPFYGICYRARRARNESPPEVDRLFFQERQLRVDRVFVSAAEETRRNF